MFSCGETRANVLWVSNCFRNSDGGHVRHENAFNPNPFDAIALIVFIVLLRPGLPRVEMMLLPSERPSTRLRTGTEFMSTKDVIMAGSLFFIKTNLH